MQNEKTTLRNEFEALLNDSLIERAPQLRNTVTGKVVKCTTEGYFVDIGTRCESFVTIKDAGQLWLGCQYSFLVTGEEDEDGAVSLSRKEALLWSDFDSIRQLETICSVKVNSISKSRTGNPCGLNGTINGIKAFIPRSEIPKREHLHHLVDHELPALILEVDQTQGQSGVVILSYKKAVDELISSLIDSYSLTQPVKCRVSDIAQSGVRVRTSSGLSGFIPKSELDYDRHIDPKEILHIDDHLFAFIIRLEKEAQNLVLSRKAYLKHQFLLEIKGGDIVEGGVVRVTDFAAFVKVGNCMDAILFRKDFAVVNSGKNHKENLRVGQTIQAKVMSVHSDEGKLVLSRKSFTAN